MRAEIIKKKLEERNNLPMKSPVTEEAGNKEER